jgi:hypothetical protein
MTADPTANPSARDARPLLGFRVGVTGHRDLSAADAPALAAAVGNVLDEVARVLTGFAQCPEAHKLYRNETPVLRLISPLAEGADRLVAGAALARGWRLAAPLPFPTAEYENDFPASVADFRDLLGHAAAGGEVVELDGTRAAAPAAYAEAGRFVLRHSDLLLAIWNGNPEAGVGGTGQIFEEARGLGIPIVHIAAAPPHAIRLVFDEVTALAFTPGELEKLLRAIVLPEWPQGKRTHARAAEVNFLHEPVRQNDTAPDFLYHGPFAAPPTLLGRLFPWLAARLGGPAPTPAPPDPTVPPGLPDHPGRRACFLHFQRADVLATHYANLHRSAFVLIYGLGAASLLAAFTAQLLSAHARAAHAAVWLEAAALGLILLLFYAERHKRWRERWLDYRSLAEMLRQSDLLALIGGAPLTGCLDRLSEMHPERGWVPWLVGAITRSVGIVGAHYDAAYLVDLRDYTANTRLADQIAYHARTTARNARINQALRRLSNGLFGLTLVAIATELAGVHTGSLAWPAWFAGVLPALSAASFGIRSQAEFEIVVHRSARLQERLSWERGRIARLTGERLSSATLGRAILQGAQIMQTDTTEWAAIFELKDTEVV